MEDSNELEEKQSDRKDRRGKNRKTNGCRNRISIGCEERTQKGKRNKTSIRINEDKYRKGNLLRSCYNFEWSGRTADVPWKLPENVTWIIHCSCPYFSYILIL